MPLVLNRAYLSPPLWNEMLHHLAQHAIIEHVPQKLDKSSDKTVILSLMVNLQDGFLQSG